MSDREYFNSGRLNKVLFSEAKDTTNGNSLINDSFINLNNIETFGYSILWYLISAFYNIYNKKALNSLKLPWFVATIQMGMGIFLFLPLWFLKIRLPPFGNINEFRYILWQLKNVGLYTSITHIAGVIALGSVTVSFTQVIKAAEPV
jgi:solute carrier family 35 protein E1